MTKKEKNTVTDIDGNTYKLVQIGTQIWTTENLTVSKYRNGDAIPQVQDATKWEALKTGAWCYYKNENKYGAIYGKLYNWYAVNDPRGLAPEGFHIPSDEEWITLIDHLGGRDVAGEKMKEKGKAHWEKPNEYATNTSGFTALPGGCRDTRSGKFFDDGNWWSSSEGETDWTWYLALYLDSPVADRDLRLKKDCFSVRCIKD